LISHNTFHHLGFFNFFSKSGIPSPVNREKIAQAQSTLHFFVGLQELKLTLNIFDFVLFMLKIIAIDDTFFNSSGYGFFILISC